jgi:hypothetical protein
MNGARELGRPLVDCSAARVELSSTLCIPLSAVKNLRIALLRKKWSLFVIGILLIAIPCLIARCYPRLRQNVVAIKV